MSNILNYLLSEVMFYLKTVVFSMKKSYLKEFQGDIGWVLLIFSFKLDAFGRYGSKTNAKSIIFIEIGQTGQHYSGKISIFLNITSFHWNCANGIVLQWENLIFLSFYQKSGYCMKIDNFSWRCIKRYCITVKKIGILLKTWYFQWFQ